MVDSTFCFPQVFGEQFIYANLPLNAITRLPHPRSGDSQDEETLLAPTAGKQTYNYDTECLNHHPSLSTLKSKGLSCSKMNIYIYIYIYYILYIYICGGTSCEICKYVVTTETFRSFNTQRE